MKKAKPTLGRQKGRAGRKEDKEKTSPSTRKEGRQPSDPISEIGEGNYSRPKGLDFRFFL